MMTYDFGGWATKNDIKCSDGRVIRKDAFKHCDGMVVPLVWNHNHNDPSNVIGSALLRNKPDGVYSYCSFNNTEKARDAKECVRHGDIVSLSIYANKLKQDGADVIHGMIREVSLVLAGANPGAVIDSCMVHGEESDEEAVIFTGEDLELSHAETEEKKEEKKDEKKTVNKEESADEVPVDDEKNEPPVEEITIEEVKEEVPAKMADTKEKTVGEVFDSLTEEQKTVVYALIGMALEENEKDGEEEPEMKHNLFDQNDERDDVTVLSHSDMEAIFSDAKRGGSLKDAAIAHGVEDIEWLFPDDRMINNAPIAIKREDDWVTKVMNGVHHTPFSRIKSVFADLTEADARAKGYIKGNFKKEEVFGLLKRTTTPTTVYKKQKLDRDDIVDITDFDIVAWLKVEMRGMLNEELARAYLVGDGRNNSSDEWINDACIRPIWTDNDLFTIKKAVNISADATDDEKAKAAMRAAIKARKEYKGSGNPTAFISEDILTDMLLMEDNVGRVIYDSVDKLATYLRVKEIVSVPVFDNLSRVDDKGFTRQLAMIIVNLNDYNVGADKGGAVNLFDDFDIDYNQQKYLIETRCSGALVRPFSAIVVEMVTELFHKVSPEDPTTVILGKNVEDIQSDVKVHSNYISGDLHYVTGYTGYSGDPDLQSGNFLALKFEHSEDATTTIFLTNGITKNPVTLDSDMNAVIRVTNKNNQKLIVTTTKDGSSVVDTYSLSALHLQKA